MSISNEAIDRILAGVIRTQTYPPEVSDPMAGTLYVRRDVRRIEAYCVGKWRYVHSLARRTQKIPADEVLRVVKLNSGGESPYVRIEELR